MSEELQNLENQPNVPQGSSGKGFCIASLVLGISAAILAWFYLVNIAALVLGITGIVLASVGKKKAVAVGASAGMGTAGLVLSIIGTVLAGIGFFSCTLCVLCASGCAGATYDGLKDLEDLMFVVTEFVA